MTPEKSLMLIDIKVIKYTRQERKEMLSISHVHIMTQEETTRVPICRTKIYFPSIWEK